MTKSKRSQLTVAIFAAMVFLSFVNLMSGTLLSHIIDYYGLKEASQGYFSSALSIGGVVALISSFVVMGRVAKTTLLKLAVGVCTAALIILRFSNGYGLFVLTCMIMGMSTGYIDTLLSACISNLYQGKKATQMMNLLHTIFSISAVTVPMIYTSLLAGFEAVQLPWNTSYLVVALLGFFVLIILIYSTRDLKESKDNSVAIAGEKLSKRLLQDKMKAGILPGLIVAMIFHNLFFSGITTWINRYIVHTLGGNIGNMALSFLWLGIMVSRIVVPMLKVGAKRYLCFAGFLTGGVLLLALPFENAVLMCIATAIAGILVGAMIPCAINIGCEASMENTMLATTSLSLAMNLGSVISAPLIGELESLFGLHTAMGINAMFIVICSVIFLFTPGVGRKQKAQ